PNPFNPSTMISYQISKSGNVSLKIFDVLGNEVLTLVNQEQVAGSYKMSFDAIKLASGLYFYELSTYGLTQVKKMLLIK
ncbi:MAG: T9SS type A sorting domain-containing protein, partial [Ignavibacteria bacterium]|nr:T9SS type A sorting domain-containing protein [Ignavibacteria bacterium]